MDGIANINGELVPLSQAKAPVLDRGLLYGDGVFEGIRFVNKKVLLHKEHMDRLFRSARMIRLPGLEHLSYEHELRRTIDAHPERNGYLRVIVSRGIGAMGINPLKFKSSNLYILGTQISLFPEELYQKGVKLATSAVRKIPHQSLDCSVKSLNYLSNIMSLWDVFDRGFDDALMITPDEYVSEASVSNIFGLKGRTLFTPSAQTNCLIGTTRNKIIEIAPELGLSVEEGLFRVKDFIDAAEVFLSGTGVGILPVNAIDSQSIGSGGIGAITKKLRDLYESRMDIWCSALQ